MTRGPIDPRLLRHARSGRAGAALLVLLGAGQAAATVIVAIALTGIVAEGFAGHLDLPVRLGRRGALLLLAAAFVARAALTWAEQVIAQRTAAAVTDELRRSTMAAALRKGPAWVARYGSGRLTAVLAGGLDALRPWFSGYLPALVLGVLLPPLVIGAMAVVDPASAVIALVTLPLIPVLGALIGWATREKARQAWAADARLAGHFLDAVRGLTTLRVYGRAERQTRVVRAMTDRHRAATVRVLRVAFLSSTALDLVGTLSVGLIAVSVGLRVAGGSMAAAPALLVILLAPEAYRPLREMAARYHASADASAVITDVDEALSPAPSPGASTGPAEPAPVLVPVGALLAADEHGRFGPGGARPAVFASRLRVRHPGAAVDALRLDGLAVREGEIVALRGPSGAGKTTTVRVLAGLQPADAGRIELSGPALWYLPQRPALPHVRTVAEAFPGLTGEEIRAELATVGLDDEVGAETILGEHGTGVSAGQRQRLALAALLRAARRAPAVLLLDEPTAHLDAEAEALVIARLREAAEAGCAILVVAHRPGLLAAADRIIDLAPPAVPDLTPPAIIGLAPPAAQDGPRSAPPAPPARPVPPPEPPAPSPFSRWAGRIGRRPGAAAGFGAASWLAGVMLTGAATWLLVRAADRPPVLTLSAAVVLVRGSAVARPLLRYLERLVSHDVAFARLGEWRARVFADLVPRVPGPRARRRGDLLTRVADDVDARVDGLLRGRLPASAAALAVAVAGVAAVLVLPMLVMPLAAGLVISGALAPALAARRAGRLEAATGRARAELRDSIVETVEGVEELAVLDRAANAHHSPGGPPREAPRALAVPDRRSRDLARLEARAARSAGAAAAVSQLGWGIAVVGTAVVLSRGGGLPAEWAAVLLLGVVALGEPVAALPEAAIARRRAAGAEARLADLTAPTPDTPPLRHEPAADARLTSLTGPTPDAPPVDHEPGERGLRAGRRASVPPQARNRGLRIRGLVAGWDPARAPALAGIDLDLPPGARVAIMGPSGGGKSTLAAVLARLLTPRAGVVAGLGTSALVGDEADHVFATTVRENLRLARPGATDLELREVLARVRLDGWLAQQPDGLDTWLGAGGGTVSGGQRRRLAAARALLADPGLLILDEPTEGLDEAGAGALMADLLAAAAGRSVLLLTHRTEGLDLVDARYDLRAGILTARPVDISSSSSGPGRGFAYR